MATGVELATAWIRLVPSVEGIQEKITEQFAPAKEQADKDGDETGKRWSSGFKKAIGAAAIGAAVAAGFKGLYEVGATFDEVADTIRTGTGATGDALTDLVAIAEEVGKSVPASFEAAGQTVSDLNTRLGLSGSTLQTVASQYLEAGRILGEQVDINATSAAFSAFKIEGDGVSAAMDTLFRVSQATGVGMNQLASGVQATAPALQNLGFSFEDSVALLGSLDKAGLNAQAVMASMSKGLVTLAKDGEQPQEAFRRVTGELQGFIDKGDTAAALDLASQVFGTRGASQFVGALQSGVLNMDDLMAATGATGDTILGVGAETQDFAEKWQITMNKATAAIEPLASAIFTGLADGITAITPTLEDIGAWASENTTVLGIVAAVIGVTLVAAFIAWAASIWATTAALLANPVTWIILGIVALIAAVVALVMNWDTVVAWITEVWGGFIGWITGVIDGFVSQWNKQWALVGQFFEDVWNGLVGWVQGLWQGFMSWIVGVMLGYYSFWMGVWRNVSSFFQSVWNGIVSFFTGVWDGIVSTVRTVGDVFGRVFSTVADIVRGAFEGVVGVVKGVINTIIGLVNGVIDGINGVAGLVGGALGLDVRLGKIPMLADGGTITRGGSVIVGERGPELLHLPAGAVVDPNVSDATTPTLVFEGDSAAMLQLFNVYERRADGRRKLVIANGKKVS